MSDKREPCRWLTFVDDDWHRCSHPVVLHHEYVEMAEGHHLFCDGCPCHEPAEPAKPVFDPAIAERITMTDIDAALHLRALLQELKTTWLRLAGLHIEITEIDDSPVTATPYTEEEEPNDA